MKQYVKACIVSLESLQSYQPEDGVVSCVDSALSVDPEIEQNEALDRQAIIGQFKGTKKKVVEFLLDGFNFNQIATKMHKDKNEIYKIKSELKMDLSWIFDEARRAKYLDENRGLVGDFASIVAERSRKLKLAQFVQIHINDYNPEAKFKDWQLVPLQNIYYEFWENNAKTCIKAPREHLKTTSVCEYLVKKIFERKYPLDIVYLHGSKDIAIEKVRDIQMMAERNPIISANFMIDQARNWKDGELRLLDGTTIYANSYGTSLVGRHPDIIVLDDVIDQKVVYSDQLNEKSIRKFYSDIYPMITDAEKNGKKIILIGTAQRENDLYASLPSDFKSMTLAAFTDQEETIPLEPVLFSADKLNKVKRDISEKFGLRFWLKEYMNIPLSAIGDIIKKEWIQTYVRGKEPPREELQIFQGGDLSPGKDKDNVESKTDYTAGVTIGTRKRDNLLEIWVLDVYRQRVEFAERLKLLASKGQAFSPLAIGIEQNVFQYDTVSTLKKQTNLPIEGITTIKNKVEKFIVDLAPHFENRKVFIPADLTDFIAELISLPYGKHDDMADALCLAILMSSKYGGEPIIDFF